MTFNIKYALILFAFLSLFLGQFFSGCSKDNSLLSQQDIVELTAEYTEVLKAITDAGERIAALEEELANTPPESAFLIQEMIERERDNLRELENKRSDLENKLGLRE